MAVGSKELASTTSEKVNTSVLSFTFSEYAITSGPVVSGIKLPAGSPRALNWDTSPIGFSNRSSTLPMAKLRKVLVSEVASCVFSLMTFKSVSLSKMERVKPSAEVNTCAVDNGRAKSG